MNKPVDELTTTWIDPFVAQYQMDNTIPCLNAIHEAEQLGTWFTSIAHGGHGEKVIDAEFRDSEQINYGEFDLSDNHKVLLNFAEQCLNDYLGALPEANKFPIFSRSEKCNLIRYNVGMKLTLKYIPQLQFYYVDSIEHAQRIDDLIQKIHNDD